MQGAEELDFRPGGSFTVGAEEELLLVDDAGDLLGERGSEVVDRLRGESAEGGAVTGEVFADQVEYASPVGTGGEDVAVAMRAWRRTLRDSGVRAMAVGLHPTAPFAPPAIADAPRYDRLKAEFAGLFRTPPAAFQVHVGLPDAATAMVAYRGLRNRLSLLRGLAASSPYWHGIDSGLASARSAVLRSYPRVTAPPLLRSYDDYLRLITLVTSAAEVPDYTYVWWDIRPQPRLGTLEVRVMDAQWSLDRVAGLTALVQGLARHAVEEPDTEDLPEAVVVENDFRACRHGLDARIIDRDGQRRPLRQVALHAVADARRMLEPDGLADPLEAVMALLVAQPEPTRQRRLWAERGPDALVADLIERTC